MAGENTYLESDGKSVSVTLSATVEKNQVAYVEGWLGISNDDGRGWRHDQPVGGSARVSVQRASGAGGQQGSDGLRRRDRPDRAHPGRHGVLHGDGDEPGRAVQGDGGEGREQRRDGRADRRVKATSPPAPLHAMERGDKQRDSTQRRRRNEVSLKDAKGAWHAMPLRVNAGVDEGGRRPPLRTTGQTRRSAPYL